MPTLHSGKMSQGLNKLKTQISKHQNKGKASVQKVVKPLAGQIPPSSPPNITSHITTEQLPNTALIAEGSTAQLPIRIISSNSMDYDSGEEDALVMQLQSSPELPSFGTLRNIYALLSFNKEGNQELPTEAEDNEEDKDEVKELFNPKRSRPKVVYGGGGPLRSSGKLTKKTLKAVF